METIYRMIIEALNDAYEDILPRYYEYDGSEKLLTAYLDDVTGRIKGMFDVMRGHENTDYEWQIFYDIYERLYDLMQRTHKGCMIDQGTLMQGAVQLFAITTDREGEYA